MRERSSKWILKTLITLKKGDTARHLIEKGADVDIVNKEKRKPVQMTTDAKVISFLKSQIEWSSARFFRRGRLLIIILYYWFMVNWRTVQLLAIALCLPAAQIPFS